MFNTFKNLFDPFKNPLTPSISMIDPFCLQHGEVEAEPFPGSSGGCHDGIPPSQIDSANRCDSLTGTTSGGGEST